MTNMRYDQDCQLIFLSKSFLNVFFWKYGIPVSQISVHCKQLQEFLCQRLSPCTSHLKKWKIFNARAKDRLTYFCQGPHGGGGRVDGGDHHPHLASFHPLSFPCFQRCLLLCGIVLFTFVLIQLANWPKTFNLTSICIYRVMLRCRCTFCIVGLWTSSQKSLTLCHVRDLEVKLVFRCASISSCR